MDINKKEDKQMSKFIYISSFIPQEIRESVIRNQKIYDGNSAEVLSKSIFQGLSENTNSFEVINIAPIGPYPHCNKSKYYYGGEYEENGIRIHDIPFSTLFGYQHISIYWHIYKLLKKELNKTEEKRLLLYSINVIVLKAIKKLQRKGYKIKLFIIIPDFWDDMLRENNLRNRLKSLFIQNSQDFYKMCAGYILLTEQMKEKILYERPYCVIEGMYNSKENRSEPKLKNNSPKILFYSGMLHKRFGIAQIADIIHKSKLSNICLKICGSGDAQEHIKNLSLVDKRIVFLGLIRREEVLNEQAKADILVNPRTPEGDFTKYSFPSKTIEYMASGTPALIHKLPGIPSEYYDYCFTFQSSSEMDILAGITHCLEKTGEELRAIGIAAQNFIISQKNAKKQTEKILRLLRFI